MRTVEIVTLRLQAIARTPKPRTQRVRPSSSCPAPAKLSTHRIFEDGRWRRAALYDRALLQPGNRIAGPAVIVELSATTFLPTGWTASVDALSNLILTPASRERR